MCVKQRVHKYIVQKTFYGSSENTPLLALFQSKRSWEPANHVIAEFKRPILSVKYRASEIVQYHFDPDGLMFVLLLHGDTERDPPGG